jgi:hypothetical protein
MLDFYVRLSYGGIIVSSPGGVLGRLGWGVGREGLPCDCPVAPSEREEAMMHLNPYIAINQEADR